MFDFVAWFDHAPAGRRVRRERWRRAQEGLAARTPEGWEEHAWSGDGWGILVRHARMDRWNWRFVQREGDIAVLAAGLPIGLDVDAPLTVGRQLLAGEDVHRHVAAPFAVLAVDEAGLFRIQQDWHGMAQVFRHDSAETTVFTNRPALAPWVVGDPVRAHVRGWSHYLVSGAFNGSTSPVRGVTQLDPGERVEGRRTGRSRWEITTETRFQLDDIVANARSRSAPPLEDIAAATAEGIRRAARSLARYWPEQTTMGLSGGKDSRLIAAAFLSEGYVPRFVTNEDNPREGEVARHLVSLLRERRGLTVDHELYTATDRGRIGEVGLAERARRVQLRNDFMFRSTYLNRPPEEERPVVFGAPSITGVFGEYLSGYWAPTAWRDDPGLATHEEARQVLSRKLAAAVPRGATRPRARRTVEDYIDRLVDRAHAHDLDPLTTITYAYMTGRIRRAATAVTHIEQVMPLALPETVEAAVQLTPGQKARRELHTALIAHLVPEWREVPYVSFDTGVAESDIYRVWHDGGAVEAARLLAQEPGPVSSLVRRDAVAAALESARAGRGRQREDDVLRQFVMAAVADERFDEG